MNPNVQFSTMCGGGCGHMQTMAPFNSPNVFVVHDNPWTGERCPGEPQAVHCGHCGRVCHDFKGGVASVNQVELCHPNEEGRPDCYHMVTVYHHDLLGCERCSRDPYEPMTPAEWHDAMVDSLRRLEQMVRDVAP